MQVGERFGGRRITQAFGYGEKPLAVAIDDPWRDDRRGKGRGVGQHRREIAERREAPERASRRKDERRRPGAVALDRVVGGHPFGRAIFRLADIGMPLAFGGGGEEEPGVETSHRVAGGQPAREMGQRRRIERQSQLPATVVAQTPALRIVTPAPPLP